MVVHGVGVRFEGVHGRTLVSPGISGQGRWINHLAPPGLILIQAEGEARGNSQFVSRGSQGSS